MNLQEIIQTLAQAAQEIAIKQLNDNRATMGFQAFVADLRDPSNNHSEQGWTFHNGLLTVGSDADHQAIQSFLNENLGHNAWFQTTPRAVTPLMGAIPNCPPTSSRDYQFKLLGKFGENPAVDPTLLVNNGSDPLKVLAIERPDKTRALPGGMNESTVRETCLNELLEECFSGHFFEPGSVTSRRLDDMPLPEKSLLTTIIQGTQQLSNDQKAIIQAVINADYDLPSQAITAITDRIQALPNDEAIKFGSCQRAQALAHVRVELYKTLCPEEFAQVKTLLEQRMEIGDSITNLSDPRNTNLAWMVTRPVGMTVNPEVIEALKQYGLEEGGAGDDATNSHFPTLEDFCCGNPYSDHAAILLNVVSRQIEEGQIEVTPTVMSQLEAIAEDYLAKLPERQSELLAVIESLTENKDEQASKGLKF